MPTISTRRKRASLALGTALALTAASLTIGVSPASADEELPPTVSYAKITDYESFSSAANKVSSWCKIGQKISPGGSSWVVDGSYSQIIVKAGSGKYANTVFGEPPKVGQTVWADTNGDGVYNPGGKGGDKGISHIILCEGTPPPPPTTTDLVVEKVWTYGEGVPDGFTLDETDAGLLTVTVGETATRQEWGQTTSGWTVGAKASVSEASVDDPESPSDFTCTIKGVPLYEVNGVDNGTVAPTFPLVEEGNTVVVTNSVDCIKDEKPTTTLKVVKQWTGVPAGKSDPAPGALSVKVDDTSTNQTWNDVKGDLPVGADAVVSETKPTLPTFDGFTCTLSDPSYIVNGGTPSATAVFELKASDNTVTVVNALACAAIVIPPVVTPPVVTPPVVTPPVVTPPVVEEVVDEADVDAEEDVVEEDEETAVAGSEDELAATGGSTSAALLGALLVLSGAALIGSRRRFGMTD